MSENLNNNFNSLPDILTQFDLNILTTEYIRNVAIMHSLDSYPDEPSKSAARKYRKILSQVDMPILLNAKRCIGLVEIEENYKEGLERLSKIVDGHIEAKCKSQLN